MDKLMIFSYVHHSRTESCGEAGLSFALEGYRHSGSDFIASSDVHRGRM